MDQLTPDQARALRDAVRSRMNYLHSVRVRMYQLGVQPGDTVYDLFGQAEDALTRLAAALHDRTLVLGDRRPWEADGSSGGGGPVRPPGPPSA